MYVCVSLAINVQTLRNIYNALKMVGNILYTIANKYFKSLSHGYLCTCHTIVCCIFFNIYIFLCTFSMRICSNFFIFLIFSIDGTSCFFFFLWRTILGVSRHIFISIALSLPALVLNFYRTKKKKIVDVCYFCQLLLPKKNK